MEVMGRTSGWLKENSGAILAVAAILGALLAILGSIFGSAAYIVSELHRVEDELRAEMRAIDGRLTTSDAEIREEIRAGDTQLREDIRSLDAKMAAGDAQLREDIRSLDAKMAASDAQLREDVRAGDAELRQALENLSNRILDILAGGVGQPTRHDSRPVEMINNSPL